MTQQNAELPAQLNGSDVYVIPEVVRPLAVQGCQEIFQNQIAQFIFCVQEQEQQWQEYKINSPQNLLDHT